MLMISPANLPSSSASQSAKPRKNSPHEIRDADVQTCIAVSERPWEWQLGNGELLASNCLGFAVNCTFFGGQIIWNRFYRCQETQKIMIGLLCGITLGGKTENMVFFSYNPGTFDWTNACDHKLVIVSSILVIISLRFWWFLLLRSLEFLH